MTTNQFSQIFHKFGYIAPPDKIRVPTEGYRSKVGIFNDMCVVVYKSDITAQMLRGMHSVMNLLHPALPVRRPLDQRILILNLGAKESRVAGLYNYLPGTTISWDGYTHKRLKSLGAHHRRFHIRANNLSRQDLATIPRAEDVMLAQLHQMKAYFSSQDVTLAMKSKLSIVLKDSFDRHDRFINSVASLKNKSVLHMDFVRSNILFDENNVCGIIDFEKLAFGHPILDVGRTLAFLYVDCKKEPIKVKKYYYESGYLREAAQTFPRITQQSTNRTDTVLEEAVGFFLLHDFYKFLLHNPYESLKENKHFLRTLDELKKRSYLVD